MAAEGCLTVFNSCPLSTSLLLQKLFTLILSSSESTIVTANAFGLYARLLTQNRAAFEQLLGNCAAAGMQLPDRYKAEQGLTPAEQLLAVFAELWCDQFDAIAVPLARKLSALGLCGLLALPSKV